MSKTKTERKLHGLIADFGCIVCRNIAGNSPKVFPSACVHHIQEGKRKQWAVIPLCPAHHQGTEKGVPSIHGDKTKFRRWYGHEWLLFLQTRRILKKTRNWPKDIEKDFVAYAESPQAPLTLRNQFTMVEIGL